MALSPALLTTMVADGFRLPIPAGTSFTAGDVVPLGPSLVGVATNDSNWDGGARASSVNAVGIYDVPATNGETIAAGSVLYWNATAEVATAVPTGADTEYPLGISIVAKAETATTVRALLWPGTDARLATSTGPINCAPGGSTAAAGSTTADAGVLPAGTASVYPTTAADDTKGVRVHASDKVTGRMIHIGNGVSNKVLKVYAPSGGAINGATADAAFSSVSGKGVVMYCLNATANTWLAW